jgi:tetratricopeptide (TPR) repeat protein
MNTFGEGALEPAIKLLWLHIDPTWKAIPIEKVQAFLDQASRLAPNDDRLWLGRANLALRTGIYDEAGRWLDACQRLRPDDVPVWKARLNWGIATDRIDVVEQAVTHLPPPEMTPGQHHRLNAWLAAKRGDAGSERRKLEQLLAADPADLVARERLARLAEREGRIAKAEELRGEKTEIDRVRARYEALYARKQPIRDAIELARLAQRLGRIFEARAFLTLAIADEPNRDDLRQELERLNHNDRAGP